MSLEVLTGVGVRSCLQEHRWLKSNCVSKRLIPAWVMSHGSCSPGVVCTAWGPLDWSAPPFSAVAPACCCGSLDPCQFPLPQACEVWFLPELSLLPLRGDVWILRRLLHSSILWLCLCVPYFCPTQLQPLVLRICHLELTESNNHRLGGFNIRDLFPHSSEGWKCRIKVSAGLVSPVVPLWHWRIDSCPPAASLPNYHPGKVHPSVRSCMNTKTDIPRRCPHPPIPCLLVFSPKVSCAQAES